MLQTLLLLCDRIQPGGQEGIRAFGEWLRGESTLWIEHTTHSFGCLKMLVNAVNQRFYACD